MRRFKFKLNAILDRRAAGQCALSAQRANSVCATSAEQQEVQQPNVLKPDAANAVAWSTKALSASLVANVNATVARHARSEVPQPTPSQSRRRLPSNALGGVTSRTGGGRGGGGVMVDPARAAAGAESPAPATCTFSARGACTGIMMARGSPATVKFCEPEC